MKSLLLLSILLLVACNINQEPKTLVGSISEVGELAFRLNPIDGSTGTSVTILDQAQLSNGEILTYDSFLSMNGSIKIHMDELYFKNMVLSYANVGSNQDYFLME